MKNESELWNSEEKESMNLLLEIEETILILVKVGEHVEALSLTDVVDHIIL